METCCFIFCFALFASAASFSIPEQFPEYANGSLQEVSYTHKCTCVDGKCMTDNRGNLKCVCKPGYAIQNETACKPCDCGRQGKCLFTLTPKSRDGFTYEKKCVCDLGSADKDGKCIDCYCGLNSACEFDGEEKNCYCIEGYSVKVGVCTRCDCGFYGACEFNRGTKQCTCDEGFLELEGICEECDCGDHGLCSFLDGAKYCQCEAGYQNNGGVCAACDCGSNSTGCRFFNGGKICECKNGFSDKSGVCAVCNCGPNTKACSFYGNQKRCKCEDDYVLKGNTCEVGCNVNNRCKNGGLCINGYCSCFQGTKGKFCEVIDACDHLCPKEHGISCTYNMFIQKPYCECLDHNLRFNPDRKQCQRTCKEGETCRNGGKCTRTEYDSFCRCRNGTEGDFCEIIPECGLKDCGTEAVCAYDVTKGRAVCQCQDRDLSFDPRDERCKNTCDVDTKCKNGGRCRGTNNSKFCECLEGTEGHFCENVVGCADKDCGKDAHCEYNVTIRAAACLCRDSSQKFDERSKKCKRTCDSDADCSNGGKCVEGFCGCLVGTSGDTCENVPDCDTIDCGPDAKCTYSLNRYSAVCECVDRRYAFDEADRTCKTTCSEDVSCHNGGLCKQRGDHLFCECKAGTSGNLCETVDLCRSGLCGYGGNVDCLYDLAKEAAVCRCRSPQHLFDPESKTCKACDCGKSALSCRFEDGKQVCVCRDGDEARNGKCQKVRCTEKRCQNGKCQVVGDDEVCSCYEGYELEGDYCRKLNCSRTPCVNGTCVVRHGNIEECVCQAGYTLQDGVCIRGACSIHTCFGGYCDVIDGELMCVCPKDYSLQGIGCFATVCRKQHCFGGWCVVNEDKEEICTCFEGYVLVNDVCKRILCTKPCFGGQCQFVDGKEECICPPGFSIYEDVCRDNRSLE